MTNKNLSIPESRKLVRRLRMDGHATDTAFALDYFHGLAVDEAVKELKRNGIKVTEEYVMRAIGRILMAT